MSLDHARHYLQRVVPWIEGSYVNLHWTTPNKKFDPAKPAGKGNQQKYLNGRAFTSVDECVKHIAYLATRQDAQDVYVCMSSQSHAEVKTYQSGAAAGRTYMSAVRAAGNATGLKSLYIDIDVKPDKPDDAYGSTQEAVVALRDFISATSLPLPTMVVSSGTGGMHVYWVMDRPLSSDEWQPLARAMSEATRRHGLKTDTQCTVNAAQILRPPGTLNHKRSPSVPVQLGARSVQPGDYPVDQLRRALTPYMGATVHTLPRRPGVTTGVTDVNDELSAGISEGLARYIDLDSVATQCGFVADALADGGASLDQPKWNLTTLLASFTMGADGSDGRAQAHRLARGHKGYVEADTDALYDRKLNERATGNIGWPSCASIHNSGCKHCGVCKLQHFNKSPLNFGSVYTAPVTTIGVVPSSAGLHPSSVQGQVPAPSVAPGAEELPVGYVHNRGGRVCRLVPLQDGTHKMVEVSPYTMHSAWVQSNPWMLHFVTRLGNAVVETQISILLSTLASREFTKTIAAQGFMVGRIQALELQEFLMAWVNTLQSIKDAVVASAPFGWAMLNSDIEGFVFANRVWGNGFDKPAASPDAVLASHYKPTGELQPWIDAAAFMTKQGRPALDAILAASFGAPLMRFTGQSGVVVSAYSQASGVGKSTLMEISQAVWAHPKKAMQGLTDTQNSVINKVGQLRSLPLFWDELKDEETTKRFVQLAFQITGGKEKSRLTADSQQRDPGTWQTLVMAASNDSLVDAIQRYVKTTEAGVLRVFEFEVPSQITHDPASSVSRLVARTHDHYGNAGLAYAQFIGANHARIATEVAACQDRLTKNLKAPNDERFWIAAITCLVMGAKFSNECGLTTIDMQSLLRFLVATLHKLRSGRHTSSSDIQSPKSLSTVFQAFLGSMRARNTLVTNRIPIGQGRTAAGVIQPIGDHSRLDHILVQYAVDQKIVLVSEMAFREWLNVRHYSPKAVIDSMEKMWSIKTKQHRVLGAGTPYARSAMKEYVMEVDLSGTSFQGIDVTDNSEEEAKP